MTGLSEQQLAEIQATDIGEWCEGPWTQDPVEGPEGEAGHFLVKDRDGQVVAMVPHWAGPIALFIAAARTDVPALLAEVARLRGALSEATGYVAELEADLGGWSARVAELEAEAGKVAEFVAARAEYITAINNCHPDNAHDYHRWQGHAESRRQLAGSLGLPVAWPAKSGSQS